MEQKCVLTFVRDKTQRQSDQMTQYELVDRLGGKKKVCEDIVVVSKVQCPTNAHVLRQVGLHTNAKTKVNRGKGVEQKRGGFLDTHSQQNATTRNLQNRKPRAGRKYRQRHLRRNQPVNWTLIEQWFLNAEDPTVLHFGAVT